MTTELSRAGLPARADTWHTELHRENDTLDRLAEEWDDLFARCRSATTFQSSAWLRSWWRHYGRRGALVVVLVRRDERLVGALALRRRGPFGALTSLGGGLCDFNDALLDDSCADRAAAELAAALPLRRPWHSLELPEVHPEAAVQLVYQHWTGRRHRFTDSLCQYLPAVSMEELLKRVPGKTAQRTRVKQRKIAQSGVVARTTPPEEVPQAVRDLLRLHFEQWQERGVTPEHRADRFAAHLAESTLGLVASRQAAVHRFFLGDELVAVNLMVLCPAFGGLYMYGARPALRERVDIAGMLFGAALDEVRGAGIPVLSLLRGQEPYKQRWRPEQLHNQRLVLGPGRFAPFAAARALWIRGRAATVRLVRDRLPGAAVALRRLRS